MYCFLNGDERVILFECAAPESDGKRRRAERTERREKRKIGERKKERRGEESRRK